MTSDSTMTGVPVDGAESLPPTGGAIPLRLWTSGLYFARIESGGEVRFAPFVLRAGAFDAERVAVVLPTNTWQAYNFRDGATWYAGSTGGVDLQRPFLDRGVPPHFRQYDLGFLRWAAQTGHQADYLADDDLESFASGDALRRRYDLLVFPGHEEYATAHAYDVVQRFRDLGGSLIFLSANDFFWRVDKRGQTIYRDGKWRDLGRPEAGLVGAQYIGWEENTFGNAPFTVTDTAAAPWLFAGTGLHDGSRFGTFGIEIDATAPSSPPGTHVLAQIPDVFGAGMTAEMTYYETGAGGGVFSAGVINFGGLAEWEPVRTMLDNLWARLAAPRAAS